MPGLGGKTIPGYTCNDEHDAKNIYIFLSYIKAPSRVQDLTVRPLIGHIRPSEPASDSKLQPSGLVVMVLLFHKSNSIFCCNRKQHNVDAKTFILFFFFFFTHIRKKGRKEELVYSQSCLGEIERHMTTMHSELITHTQFHGDINLKVILAIMRS